MRILCPLTVALKPRKLLLLRSNSANKQAAEQLSHMQEIGSSRSGPFPVQAGSSRPPRFHSKQSGFAVSSNKALTQRHTTPSGQSALFCAGTSKRQTNEDDPSKTSRPEKLSEKTKPDPCGPPQRRSGRCPPSATPRLPRPSRQKGLGRSPSHFATHTVRWIQVIAIPASKPGKTAIALGTPTRQRGKKSSYNKLREKASGVTNGEKHTLLEGVQNSACLNQDKQPKHGETRQHDKQHFQHGSYSRPNAHEIIRMVTSTQFSLLQL